MKTTNMTQIPIGTKVRLKNPYWGKTEGIIVAAERIVHNKPHRIMHSVLFDGLEDQYDYRSNPVVGMFKATQLIIIE